MDGRWTERLYRGLLGNEGDVITEVEIHVVTVSTAVAVSGTFVVAPVVSTLSVAFGVTEAVAGQSLSAFTAPAIVLIPIAGIVTDRFGRKPLLVVGLLVFGSAGTAIAVAPNFDAVLVLRAIQGAGYAAIVPVTITLIGDLYEGTRETTAQGLRAASVQVVSLSSAPLSGLLVVVAWQMPFLLYGVALVAAVWAWRVLPSVQVERGSTMDEYVRELATFVTRPLMLVVLSSFVVRFTLTFAFFSFVSVLVGRVYGGTAVASGLLVSLFGLTALSSTTQAGRIAARWGDVLALFAGFGVSGAGMVLMGYAGDYPLAVVGVALFGAGSGITSPSQKSIVTRLPSKSIRAGSVSSAFVFQALGQTAGPLLMGLALQFVPAGDAFVALGVAGGTAGLGLSGILYHFGVD